MSEQENIALVQEVYNNFKSGNIPALLERISPDIDWELPEISNVPFSGKRQGREAVAQFFALLSAGQESLRFEPTSYIAQGDKVVALGNYEWRVLANGNTFASSFAHVFTVGNGQITAFHEYADTAVVEKAHQKAMSA